MTDKSISPQLAAIIAGELGAKSEEVIPTMRSYDLLWFRIGEQHWWCKLIRKGTALSKNSIRREH